MVEDRLFLHIEMDARQEFRQIAAHELADGLIFDFRIDPEVLHVLREVVPDGPEDQVQVAMQEGRGFQPALLLQNLLPRCL